MRSLGGTRCSNTRLRMKKIDPSGEAHLGTFLFILGEQFSLGENCRKMLHLCLLCQR